MPLELQLPQESHIGKESGEEGEPAKVSVFDTPEKLEPIVATTPSTATTTSEEKRKGSSGIRTESPCTFEIWTDDEFEGQQQEIVEVAGVFATISEVEKKLGEKAQGVIGELPINRQGSRDFG